MNILVTGGAGFIGSHVCDQLVGRKEHIICVDDFNDYYDPNVKENNVKKLLQKPNFTLYRGDIRDYAFLEHIFTQEKIEKVIHLAARAGVRPSIKNPVLYEEVNIKGTTNLLELSRLHNVQNFVFGSSSSVYGKNKKVPFSEEDDTDNMISPYAATKRAGEMMCLTYNRLYNLKCTCLRFFTVYGPRGRPDMAPYKFTRLIDEGKPIDKYGPGTSKRDYTYVGDIVAGVIAAVDKDLDFEIINLGNSDTIELNQFIKVIEGLLGKKAIVNQLPEQPGDVPATYADVSKAKKLLNYNPKTPLKEGMKKFVEWYAKNKEA